MTPAPTSPTAPRGHTSNRAARRPRRRQTRRPQHATALAFSGARLRVALYLRISTDELLQPFSLEAQELKLGAYIDSQDNWELACPAFIDQASGATTDRPALKRALNAAAAGRFDVLLVYRVDRLSRSIRSLSEILAKLDDVGVAFRSATEPFDTATPAGRMMVQMLAVFAEFERATIIDRVINGMERKAARGQWCGGYRPHGYELDRDTSYLTVIEDEAVVVRRIFTTYVHERGGAKALARKLTADGHRTKSGKPWSSDAVLTVLRNRVYLGEIWYRDKWHKAEQHHPAIIDQDLFDAAQQLLIARGDEHNHRAAPRSDYLLAGLLFCQHCGKRYLGTAANGNRYRYRYYTCFSRHRYGPETCAAERLPADQLEDGVLRSLLHTLTRNDLIDTGVAAAHAELDQQRRELSEELAAVESQLAKTEEAIERYLTAFENGTMPESACSHRVDKLAAKLADLQGRRDELGLLLDEASAPAAPGLDMLQAARNYIQHVIDHGTPDDLRAVTQAFVHRVDITGRHKAKPTFKLPTDDWDTPTQPDPAQAADNSTCGKVRTLPGTAPSAGFEPATPASGGQCSIP